MNRSTIASSLLACGVIVALVAAAALVLGLDPTRLPPFLVRVALFKLTFIVAAALLATGAVVRRRARQSPRETNRHPGHIGLR